MTLDEAMRDACAAIGIKPPDRTPVPGRWRRTDTLGKNGRSDASVMIFDDQSGGIAWNWQTQTREIFRLEGERVTHRAPPPDPARRKREADEQREVARICGHIVQTARPDVHKYLVNKGFPEEVGLVHDDPLACVPDTALGRGIRAAMPSEGGPFLIVPGRVGDAVTTVQFIGVDGSKKNIYRGRMDGASHRISTGRETWVCEGIATAMTIRAALRLLGRSATVLSAFSASNVERVARSMPGSWIVADHDKPVEQFKGLGTGEFYARRSGRPWIMPSGPGDFNDHHQASGLRSVAISLREAG